MINVHSRPQLPTGTGITYFLRVARDRFQRQRGISKLKRQRSRLEADLHNYHVALAAKARQTAAEHPVMSSFASRLVSLDSSTALQQSQVDAATRRLSDLRSNLDAAVRTQRDAQQALAKLKQEQAQLEKAPPSPENSIRRTELATEIKRATEQGARDEQTIKDLRLQIQAATAELSGAQRSTATAKGETTAALAELGVAIADDADLVGTFPEEWKLIHSTQSAIAEARSAVSGLEADLTGYDPERLRKGRLLFIVALFLPILFLPPIYIAAVAFARRETKRRLVRFAAAGVLLAGFTGLLCYTEASGAFHRNRAGSLDFKIASIFRDAIAQDRGVMCTQSVTLVFLFGGRCSVAPRDEAARWAETWKTCWEVHRAQNNMDMASVNCAGGAYATQEDVERALLDVEREVQSLAWDGRKWSIASGLVLLPLAYFFFIFACLAWTRRDDLWPSSDGRLKQARSIAWVSLGMVLVTVLTAGVAAHWSGEFSALVFGVPVALAPLGAAIRLLIVKGIDAPTGAVPELPDEGRVRIVVLAVAGALVVLAFVVVTLVIRKSLPDATPQSHRTEETGRAERTAQSEPTSPPPSLAPTASSAGKDSTPGSAQPSALRPPDSGPVAQPTPPPASAPAAAPQPDAAPAQPQTTPSLPALADSTTPDDQLARIASALVAQGSAKITVAKTLNARGMKFHKTKIYDRAAAAFEAAYGITEAAYLTPIYNRACVGALQGDATKAAEWLKKLSVLGTPEAQKLLDGAKKDKDLDKVRTDPAVKEALSE